MAAPATARPAFVQARPSPARRVIVVPIAHAPAPAAAPVSRDPAVNADGASGVRTLVIREYNATVGATEGNIIAAIITTQSRTNQPKPLRAVQGPASIPRICPAAHHQPAAATRNSAMTRPSRSLTAANAGR